MGGFIREDYGGAFELRNESSRTRAYNGALYTPGCRQVRWYDYVDWVAPRVADGRAYAPINGIREEPLFGWARPWGTPYQGGTGAPIDDLIRHTVGPESPAILENWYRIAEATMDRMPMPGHKVGPYQRHDLHHFMRAIKPLEALADLGDEKAKQIIQGWAREILDETSATYLARRIEVAANPHVGGKFGRPQAHMLYTYARDYRYGGGDWRGVAHDWLRVLAQAQVMCTGTWMRVPTNKVYGVDNGVVNVWLAEQHAMLCWGAWAWYPEFRGEGWYVDMMVKATQGLFDSHLWDEERGGIIWNVQIAPDGPRDRSWCDNWPLHSLKLEEWHMHDLAWMSHKLTGDTTVLEKCKRIDVKQPANAALFQLL